MIASYCHQRTACWGSTAEENAAVTGLPPWRHREIEHGWFGRMLEKAVNALNIFITGASGFVGGAAARRLAAEGHRVRAMSRSSSSDQKIGAEPVRCAEVVIPCAAFVEQWGPPDAWDRINVHGPRRMLGAAQQAGARRFIHMGTEAAKSAASICAASMRRLRWRSTVPTRTAGPKPWRNRACATRTAQALSGN